MLDRSRALAASAASLPRPRDSSEHERPTARLRQKADPDPRAAYRVSCAPASTRDRTSSTQSPPDCNELFCDRARQKEFLRTTMRLHPPHEISLEDRVCPKPA